LHSYEVIEHLSHVVKFLLTNLALY